MKQSSGGLLVNNRMVEESGSGAIRRWPVGDPQTCWAWQGTNAAAVMKGRLGGTLVRPCRCSRSRTAAPPPPPTHRHCYTRASLWLHTRMFLINPCGYTITRMSLVYPFDYTLVKIPVDTHSYIPRISLWPHTSICGLRYKAKVQLRPDKGGSPGQGGSPGHGGAAMWSRGSPGHGGGVT